MGALDRESVETIIALIGAEARGFEFDLVGISHHLDEIRVGEVADQIDCVVRERCGRLQEIVTVLEVRSCAHSVS